MKRAWNGTNRPGFTLIELMVGVVASSILMLGVVNVVADNQRAFVEIRRRAFGDVVTDSYVARATFDRIVRSATIRHCVVSAGSAEVYFFSTTTGIWPDRYARFYRSGSNLGVEIGSLAPGTFTYASANTPSTRALASHVSACTFVQAGATLRMYLTLDDGSTNVNTSASAMRMNR